MNKCYIATVELVDGNCYRFKIEGYISMSDVVSELNDTRAEFVKIGHSFFKRTEIRTLFIDEVTEEQADEIIYGRKEAEINDGTDHN